MRDKVVTRVLPVFLLIAAVIVCVAVAAVHNINRSVTSSDWVNHTHSVILEAEALQSDVYLADGTLHTFVLTGNPRDEGACAAALADADEDLEITKALTRNEPAQARQVAEIGGMVEARSAFLNGVMSSRSTGGPDAVRKTLSDDAGGAALHRIKGAIDRLKNSELELLTERDKASYLQAQTMRYTVWIGVVLDVLLLGASGWVIQDDINARRRLASALQDANEKLEVKVKERTAELEASNARLTAENLERLWTNQALEHQLRYNNLIVESVSDLVFVLTKALNISRLNPAVTQETGFSATDLVGQPLSRVVRVASRTSEDALSEALGASRELRDCPGLLEDKRGGTRAAYASIVPLRDRDKVVGAVVTVRVDRQAPGPQK